jgi:hypothetical protein
LSKGIVPEEVHIQVASKKYLESFRINDKMSITSFGRTVQRDLNLTPSRSKLARARRLIMKKIHSDEVEKFNMLWDYGQKLRRSNPESGLYGNLANLAGFHF